MSLEDLTDGHSKGELSSVGEKSTNVGQGSEEGVAQDMQVGVYILTLHTDWG